MIPYPKEPSPSASRGRTPPPLAWTGPVPGRQLTAVHLPAASCPSEGFEAFIHVNQLPTPSPTPLQRATSPIAHLVRGLLPAKPRASDFQARAFQAQEHDVWRERLLREGEGIEGRVELWREMEQGGGSARAGQFGPAVTEGVRARAQRDGLARRSRSPSAVLRHPQQQHLLTPTRPIPSISITRPESDSPTRPRPRQGRRDPRPTSDPARGHFHIESTSTDDHLLQHHHRTEPNFQQSYDLRDRTVVVRKRDLLAHPVEAFREGRVRRGEGAEEMFRSEDESGESVREAQITPYKLPSSRAQPNRPQRHQGPPTRNSVSPSTSLELPASLSEPVTLAGGSVSDSSSAEELYTRLRKELGPDIDSCWFSFAQDGTVLVDDRNQRHRSPDNVGRDWIDVLPLTTPGGGRGVALRETSPTPSSVPPSRPALVPTHRDAPVHRHSSFIPPTSLADQRMTSHLAHQILAHHILDLDPRPVAPFARLTIPSPLRRSQTLEPSHDPFALALGCHSDPSSIDDDWEHLSAPTHVLPALAPHARTMIGIGSLSVPKVEWDRRGKWVGWRKRGDWVHWKNKPENALGRGKKRWERKSGEFEYDY